MTFSVRCPDCGKEIRVILEEHDFGTVTCERCKAVLEVEVKIKLLRKSPW